MEELVIIGGGASGMVAAIAAARAGGQPILLEGGERVGKKLLSTGNGKCNFSNTHLTRECYRSSSANFPMKVLKSFGTAESLAFFDSLGIVPRIRNGYVYPRSEQASSVLDALRRELKRLRVDVRCSQKVTGIRPIAGGFRLTLPEGVLDSRKVILATGGCAAPKTGSDGSGYALAGALGHTIIKPFPALVQLRVRESFMKSVAGVRNPARVHILLNGEEVCTDSGEVQLTDYGISGIPVFQVSRFAAQALQRGQKVLAILDFLPELTEEELTDFLWNRKKGRPEWSDEELLLGILPKKLAALCARQRKGSMVDCLKHFPLQVTATNGFDQAQVSAGGVAVSQVDAATCQSRKVPGLYLTGELLDVDGICGGYNLQWAWATGYLAGTHAAGKDHYASNQ